MKIKRYKAFEILDGRIQVRFPNPINMQSLRHRSDSFQQGKSRERLTVCPIISFQTQINVPLAVIAKTMGGGWKPDARKEEKMTKESVVEIFK